MDTNDSYTIVFTNEMLKSIGIDTENNSVEVEMTIENGNAIAPTTPGLGIDWNFAAIDGMRIS